MKICILSNFGPGFGLMGTGTGGSEIVIQHVAERLIKDYNYFVDIYAFNYKKHSTYNNINLFPCEKGDKLISQISQKYDHLFCYSDSFWELKTLINNLNNINCKISIALVGAYFLQSHPDILKILKENINKFNLITHSTITPDYQFCIDNNLPVSVISNGIDQNEFNNNSINFREKYNIKNQHIILGISNFFFGKGNEVLPDIYDRLGEKLEDYIIIQISSTVDYPHDKIFLEKCKKKSHGANIRFLRDIPREDVVAALKCSNVFVSHSRKEVAPLVILECRAAKLPWVSLRVGNVNEQKGGIPIDYTEVDSKGYVNIDNKVIKHFYMAILQLLKLEHLREQVIREGQENIEQLDWKNILPLYHKVFNK
jgi:glycosyltransferase involved in cell wall biosynthesis